MTTKAVQIGIIGFGRIGAEHANWIAHARGIHLSAVTDMTEARRTLAADRGLNIAASIDDLLTDPTIDAILVAVPTALHFDLTIKALAAGKHVMVEKPMALDLPQSQQMLAEAKKQHRILSVFQNRRWDLDYLTIRQALHSGIFGKLINVESRLGQFASCVGPAAREYRPNWRNEKAFGGGGLYDWGSHFVDQLWHLMLPAKPLRVFAQLCGNVWSTDCDDFARLSLDFDSGAVALVEINTTTLSPLPRWHIDGTAGSAQSPFSLAFDINQWADADFTPLHGPPVKLPKASPGLTESDIWTQFAAAIRQESPPAVTPESVLPTMAILDAARESSRRGQSIPLQWDNSWE